MPARRHLWRGIHDPEMVRDAIEFTVTDEPGVVALTLRNRGADTSSDVRHATPRGERRIPRHRRRPVPGTAARR